MKKFDPHQHERFYKQWKEKGMPIEGINEKSVAIIREYIEDMEIGANVSVSSPKGSRSYGRLRNIKGKMLTWTVIFEQELGIESLSDLEYKERELLQLVKRMRDKEVITWRNRGKPIEAVGTYIKMLKSFWHWWQRVNKRKDIKVQDVTIDLDGRDRKPEFNYFTIEQLQKLCNHAKSDYRVLMMFLFDSGIRAPTELMNIRGCDLEWNEKEGHYILHIRDEISKTFGRKIKLLLCSKVLREYVTTKKIGREDRLFTKTAQRYNQYLKCLGHRVLGLGVLSPKSEGKVRYGMVQTGLTLYDFRHCSACYWVIRYKSESALKYRFGWKKSDMIHYYTQFLGMKDTIQEDDLFIDVTKTELEQKILDKENQISLLKEQIDDHEKKLEEVLLLVKALSLEREYDAQQAQSAGFMY